MDVTRVLHTQSKSVSTLNPRVSEHCHSSTGLDHAKHTLIKTSKQTVVNLVADMLYKSWSTEPRLDIIYNNNYLPICYCYFTGATSLDRSKACLPVTCQALVRHAPV